MARFDVYANPAAAERRHTPLLLDVQNNYVDALGTRIVVALRKVAAFGPRARHLNPVFTVADEDVVLDTATLGAVPAKLLRKPIANLRDERALIQEALDTLFGAF
jgi:toxin CcdB